MRDIKNWLLGLLSVMIVGFGSYGVDKVEKLAEDINTIKVWQAKVDTESGNDHKSYDEFTSELKEVNASVNEVRADVRAIKETQTLTWNKVLELDSRLRDLESQVDEMKRVVFHSGRP